MRIPLRVVELGEIDGFKGFARIETTPEGLRFLARWMTGDKDEPKLAEVEMVDDRKVTSLAKEDR